MKLTENFNNENKSIEEIDEEIIKAICKNTTIEPDYYDSGILGIDIDSEPYEVSPSQLVEMHICPNYVGLIAFSHPVNMQNVYFNEVGWGLSITLPYAEALRFIDYLGYELFKEESAVVYVELPFMSATQFINHCKLEVWVNKKDNPFEYKSSGNFNKGDN